MAADLPSARAEAAQTALDRRFQLVERRLALLEQLPVSPANTTADFLAREGETLFVQAPTAGIVGLLPAPTSRNRGAMIRLVFQTENAVELRAVAGTVNGQTSLRWTRVGAYAAVSDGSGGWWITSLDLPRARDLFLQDWFISGNTTSGSIGDLGWNLFGVGTPAVTRNSNPLSSSSKLTLATTAAANDHSSLVLGDAEALTIATPESVSVLQAVWNFNGNVSNKRSFFGMCENFANAPAASGDALGILFDSSISGNYQLLVRTGSAGSPVDSGVAASSSAAQMLTIWQATPDLFRCYVGSTLLGTLSGATTSDLNIGFRVETLTTAAKSMRMGYFGLRALGLDNAMDDDIFLQA